MLKNVFSAYNLQNKLRRQKTAVIFKSSFFRSKTPKTCLTLEDFYVKA